VGLIVTGATYVNENGRRREFQNSIAYDEVIHDLRKLTSAVHRHGAKIALQLFHRGKEAKFFEYAGKQPLAPSLLERDKYFEGKYRAMKEGEIWGIVRAFGDAARRAKEAKFDAVQIHGAHGMLFSQFLSPYSNRRKDNWGGRLTNRLKLHRETYFDIRRKTGESYPILIKIGVEDGFPEGLRFSEGKEAAVHLAKLGFNALEISLGIRGKNYANTEFPTKIDTPEKEGYYRNWAREIKNKVKVPVALVGGLRTYKLMEEIVENGEADFVSLSRPLIRDPNIIADWERGSRRRATCISCNRCLDAIFFEGKPMQCIDKTKMSSTDAE
jgi:2,4-dienoyl-CoA reductase-like NADH-dependent reductase (Old Yellow Enzyme family)